ncbi:MAG: AMP-binding protein, partial [Anaerovorax sp.]
MSHEEYTKKWEEELVYAKNVVENFKKTSDKRVMYKDSRPIVNIKHMWETSVEKFENNVAFHVKDKQEEAYRKITYREAKSDVDALGTALIAMGLKGEKIGVIGDNRYEWAISYLAIMCGVGIVVPLDKELTANELAQLMKAADVECIIFTKKYEQIFKEMKDWEGSSLKILIN